MLPPDRPDRLRAPPEPGQARCAHNFPSSRFLDEPAAAALGAELARAGIAGGAVYDGLVGATARAHRLKLLSHDARARSVYESLGVRLRLIG